MVVACLLHLVVIAELSAVVLSQWVYTWPYQSDGSCDCTSNISRGEASFSTERECLEAFADEDLEYCRYGRAGIVQQQCLHAVSIQEGYTNGDCASSCTRLVAGVISTADFTELCKFEFVVPFADSVAVLPDSCYSNYVYGWSDYDANDAVQTPPLRVLTDVSSPAKCQELCQLVPECVFFNWRAMPESLSSLDGFQNAPQTCILYDQSYMNGVFSHTTSMAPTAYCNVQQIDECASPPWESTDRFNLFDDYKCLTCGCQPQCAWLSASHITGPAFCEAAVARDVCHYERPTWTSTLPPCEEPSTTEALEIGGTSETDFVRLWQAKAHLTDTDDESVSTADTAMTSERVETETSTDVVLSSTTTLPKETETVIELVVTNEGQTAQLNSHWH